jgi:hypothetical protein
MYYLIQEKALKLLEKGLATNLKVGCSNKFGLNCGKHAVYKNLREVEKELIYINNFVGSDAYGFYVIIED